MAANKKRVVKCLITWAVKKPRQISSDATNEPSSAHFLSNSHKQTACIKDAGRHNQQTTVLTQVIHHLQYRGCLVQRVEV